MTHSVELLGFEVARGTGGEIAERCAQGLVAARASGGPRRPVRVVALNPEKVMACRGNAELDRFVKSADVLLADGIGICIGALLLRRIVLPRVAGADLMPRLCEEAARHGLTVYLYGAAPEVNATAAAELTRRYPSLRIAGRASGYGDADAQRRVIAEIEALRPDMVFVALGSPRQEIVIDQHLAHLDIGLVQGVGGTFDVLAGSVGRAPRAFRMLGLEWFYRLLVQPIRWRRQLALVHYMRLVFRSAIGG